MTLRRSYTGPMEWTDERPPWLPPIPPPNRGRFRIALGMVLLFAGLVTLFGIAIVGGTAPLLLWWPPVAGGLFLMMSGLLSRRRLG